MPTQKQRRSTERLVPKSYGQFCALARALDHIGDRWMLLIIRELLLGSARYSDLRRALPGIASNLLAERLRSLEADGIVRRRKLRPPAGTPVYELTELGADLEDAVLALIRWGGVWLAAGPGNDFFQPQWIALALRALLPRTGPSHLRGSVEIRVGDIPVAVRLEEGHRTVELYPTGPSATVIEADAQTVLGLATGSYPLARAVDDRRLRVVGDATQVEAILRARPGD